MSNSFSVPVLLCLATVLGLFPSYAHAIEVFDEATGFELVLDDPLLPVCVVVPSQPEPNSFCDGIADSWTRIIDAVRTSAERSGGRVTFGGLSGTGDTSLLSTDPIAVFYVTAEPQQTARILSQDDARIFIDSLLTRLRADPEYQIDVTSPLAPMDHPSGPVFRTELALHREVEFGESVQNQIVYAFSGGFWLFTAVFAISNGDHSDFRPLAQQVMGSIRFPPPLAPAVAGSRTHGVASGDDGNVELFMAVGAILALLVLCTWLLLHSRRQKS